MASPATRRDLLSDLWRAGGLALVAAFGAVLWRALGAASTRRETAMSTDEVTHAAASGGGVVGGLWIAGSAETPVAMDLTCTHLGCRVAPVPTGFECPCHRSRYDAKGNAVAGPARRALARVSLTRRGQTWIAKG